MSNKNALKVIAVLFILFSSGCWCATGDLDGVPVGEIPTVTPKPPTEIPPPTDTPASAEEPAEDRCFPFQRMSMDVIQLGVNPEDAIMGWYINMPGGVPGLEKQDALNGIPYEYHIELGDMVSGACQFLGYEERLYCFMPVNPDYLNSLQDFKLMLNDCSDPLLHFPEMSVIAPTPTVFDDIPVDCGNKPDVNACSADYENWCACSGGTYTCVTAGLFGVDAAYCVMP